MIHKLCINTKRFREGRICVPSNGTCVHNIVCKLLLCSQPKDVQRMCDVDDVLSNHGKGQSSTIDREGKCVNSFSNYYILIVTHTHTYIHLLGVEGKIKGQNDEERVWLW